MAVSAAPQESLDRRLAAVLGALTGLVALIAMIRLIGGAGFNSMFAWVFLLSAMLPWIAYCSWRARHGRLRPRAGALVLGLSVVGLVSVWLFTLGPVLALICSLIAFVVIWVHDWPKLRERSVSQYVGVAELTADPDDVATTQPASRPGAAADYTGTDAQPGRTGYASGALTTDIPTNAA